MNVDTELVKKLAHLSRLQFTEAELEPLRQDMEKIIGFVEKLNELDTNGVEPLRHMSELDNVLRPDEVKGSITRAEGLKNAAHHDGIYLKVPKVIQK